jgi:hypothetical protein
VIQADYQDWVAAIEAKAYTHVIAYGPDLRKLASGRARLDPPAIQGIIQAVSAANETLRGRHLGSLQDMNRDFSKAVARFFEMHPQPFLSSELGV